MTIIWPDLLRPRVPPTVALRNFALSGGRTLAGVSQYVFHDAGFWAVTMREVLVYGRERVDAYNAMLARLRQGEDVLLPIFTLYEAVGARAGDWDANLDSDADVGATEITATVSAIDVRAGTHFSFGNNLHRVTEVTSAPVNPPFENTLVNGGAWDDEQPWTDAVETEATYGLKILPPLRASYLAGQVVRFRDPRVRCVLEDMNAGDLALDINGVATPTLPFVEFV